MLAITGGNFEAEVRAQPGLVVLDWWGPRCAPCLALMPHMEKLADRWVGQVLFRKVNAQENRQLAVREQVMALPTIAFYHGGVKVDQLAGAEVRIDAVEERLKSLGGLQEKRR